MKMRRTRVRSLLAGCISCLRCVRTSALTCRSSPQCVPPRAQQSPPLGSRCLAPLAVCYDRRNSWFPQQLSSSRDARFRESSLCILELVPRCLSPLSAPRRRAYLSLRRNRAGHQARGDAICRPVPCARVSKPRTVALPKKLYLNPPLEDDCRRSRQKINEAVTDGNGRRMLRCAREGDLNARASASCFC